MKKLAGSSWGADATTLKTLYTGRVRPVLEYGMAAWGTTARTHFDRVSKIQNQATRIITGAMKTTPILELESVTGLQPLEDRRDTKLLTQAAKYKRLQNHPMKTRLEQPTKGRLKRGSFVHQSRILERKHEDFLDQEPKEIPRAFSNPPWTSGNPFHIQSSVPGVGPRDSQSGPEKKSYTLEFLESKYPKSEWTHVYTDGSATDAVRNGGAGIFIQYPGGAQEQISVPTGLYSTNFRAEAEALKTAATLVEDSELTTHNIVFLSDALSVLQSLERSRNTEVNELASSLSSLSQKHTVVLQWIPAHCNVHGNEMADSLSKNGSAKEQTDKTTSYSEARTIIKAKQKEKWKKQHPKHNKDDAFYHLTRKEQVILFRLRTGHNRLNHHLNKLKICSSDQCPCGTGAQTTDHVLQSCPLYEALRLQIWPDEVPVSRKLHGTLEELRRTATFIDGAGLSI